MTPFVYRAEKKEYCHAAFEVYPIDQGAKILENMYARITFFESWDRPRMAAALRFLADKIEAGEDT